MPNISLLQGDCLEVLKTLEDNSVDSIVTDPPYELGFMGKSWDNTGIANNVDMWKECLRVLKPGGHLLAFGGTRTYHRMAVAIEDAGFEVRDMIEWVYGCLSEDTEILTESGYKPLHKLTQYDRIGVYDIENNIYKWERPQRYSVYKVHQDTAYRIKSDYTDQIVSRNHRCLVEREGKLVFVTAEELKEVEYMPTLSEDFYSLQEGHRKLLLKELLWKGKRLAQKLFSKWTRKEVSSERIEVRKEPSLERWSNLLEETRKLQADKICEVSEGVFTDGEKRWICNGTSFDSGSILGDMFRENPSSASYQSRPTGQPTGKPDVISIKQGTQIIRRARVEKIEYSGIIFCPTVSTGAFIARRNGQVFITGNSGFQKSLNIGKAVDKLQGNERIPAGRYTDPNGVEYKQTGHRKNFTAGNSGSVENCSDDRFLLTKGASEFEGWGTALKPALEPITVARKPLEKGLNVASNCLKWGVGGINIDGSRVPTSYNSDDKVSDNTLDTFPSQKLYELRGKLYTLLLSSVADKKDCQSLSSVDGYVQSWKVLQDCLDDCSVCLRLYDVLSPLFLGGDQVPVQQLHDVHDDISRLQQEQSDNPSGQDTDHLSSLGDFSQLVLTYLNDTTPNVESKAPAGRFPANLIHDGSDEVVGLFPSPHGAGVKREIPSGVDNNYMGRGRDSGVRIGDSGSASRFF